MAQAHARLFAWSRDNVQLSLALHSISLIFFYFFYFLFFYFYFFSASENASYYFDVLLWFWIRKDA